MGKKMKKVVLMELVILWVGDEAGQASLISSSSSD
jgi:hypothetical protein